MVPKTNQTSSKQGAQGSSSSSTDLYNKTHEFVLSRTPDQSLTSQFLNKSLRAVIASISLEIGWNSAHSSVLDVLADIVSRYLQQVAKQTTKYAEHYGRTAVNEDDLVLGLRDMNISVSELEEYVQNFEPVRLPKEPPYFPVPRKTDLNFLRPGSDEVITRPVHVHEYMPPMIFEQPEDAEKEKDDEDLQVDGEGAVTTGEIRIKSEVEDDTQLADGDGNQLQNGMMMPLVLEEPSQVPDVGSELVLTDQVVVITEEVEVKTENDDSVVTTEVVTENLENSTNNEEKENELEQESSDDEIEPGLKAATMFATFKSTKKLGVRTENAAIKRIRKLLEEQGHPVREVRSVIMTREGFLSPFAIGCLPDTKPPSNKDFFDSGTSVTEKKKKPPTMKKILEGVKKLEKGGDNSEENDEPGLFGVMDKIVAPSGGAHDDMLIPDENGALVEKKEGETSKKKLSKQERKLLHQKKKEKKLKVKAKSKEKQLLKQAKANVQASISKELESTSSKDKLKIFTKKLKASKIDGSGGSVSKKKKKEKKAKSRPKELKVLMNRIDVSNPELISRAPVDTEMIDSDEDFSNVPDEKVAPTAHNLNPALSTHPLDRLSPMLKDKSRKDGKIKPQAFELIPHQLPPNKKIKLEKQGLRMPNPPIRTKLTKLKRPLQGSMVEGMPPLKKKRGRPKKVWTGDISGIPGNPGVSPGGAMSLPAAQLADIGKTLMTMKKGKEPQLNVMKIRKEHMEVQDLVPRPPMFTTKPPTLSPSKGMGGPALVNADLLKRLPTQPGLIPEHIPIPSVRLPKELSSSISVTPSLSSPQKEVSPVAAPSQRNLASNMCSSVTITRIEMSPSKLPSRFDDAITPGIGPPPGMESPIKRSKFGKPPPLLQIPVVTETESGITITPIVMGGGSSGGGHGSGSGKDHNRSYEHPLPPPPPLQERPQKHSMLEKLDEELSSTPSATSSKEQRRKDKEKRKELRKEKKKKAKDKDKDKSKDKSEKKKKKKDKSGESAASDTGDLPVPAIVPKLTLKIGGHSNTPTPVDSPNPPQTYHEPPIPGPTPPPKKLTFKGLHQEPEPKPPKQQPRIPNLSFPPEEEDLQVARFAPLVTRPQKPPRAAKAHAAAAVAAMNMGASVSHQDIVQFPAVRDSSRGDGGNKRGRGRPPKGGTPEATFGKVATPSGSKPSKSSLTVLETETVGCIIDDQGNKIWICPACGRQDDGSPMIGCDICDDWYHFTCVGITEEPKEEEHWYCQRCTKKQKEGKQKKRK